MAKQNLQIALVGGTGFIGREVSRVLRQRGHAVRLVARSSPPVLQPGERFSAADTSRPETLLPALQGCTCVVHLVAILAERGQTFDAVIHHGSRNVACAAHEAHIPHMVYVSALGADTQAQSAYARAKGYAEAAVRTFFPQAAILRPSLVMGQGGGFRQQIDLLTRHSPFMVLPGYGTTKFQPVDVTTLAERIADACITPTSKPQNVVGPRVLTFRDLATKELQHLHRKRLLLPLPWSLTQIVAILMSTLDKVTQYHLIPSWLLVTPDQVRLLRQDNISQS
ncbi:MAG: complex I NDUFA9 subunit family protein [Pseudomonas fluorescens]|nr:MAG: complex I NDUFA9 subunit family protein [Pseudomonas fluorescens]